MTTAFYPEMNETHDASTEVIIESYGFGKYRIDSKFPIEVKRGVEQKTTWGNKFSNGYCYLVSEKALEVIEQKYNAQFSNLLD